MKHFTAAQLNQITLYEIYNIHDVYKPAKMFWNHLYPTWSKKSNLSLGLCQFEKIILVAS